MKNIYFVEYQIINEFMCVCIYYLSNGSINSYISPPIFFLCYSFMSAFTGLMERSVSSLLKSLYEK